MALQELHTLVEESYTPTLVCQDLQYLFNNNNNNNTLFTHATSRSNKNSLKHVRETKSIENKRNSLKLPF